MPWKQAFDELGRLMAFMRPRRNTYFAGLIGDSLSNASIAIVLSFVFHYLLDFAIDRDTVQLYRAIALVSGIFVVLSIVSPLCNYVYHRCVKLTMAEIRARVFGHMSGLPQRYFETRHSGDLLSRVTQDVQTVEQTYSEHMKTVTVELLTFAGSIVVVLALDYRFALALIAIGLLSVLINTRFARPMRRTNDLLQQRLGRWTERLTDLTAGLQTVKLFSLRETILMRSEEANEGVAEAALRRGHQTGMLEALNFALQFLSFGGILTAGLILVSRNQMELGALGQIVQLQTGISLVFLQLGSTVSLMQSSFAGMARIREVLDEPLEPIRYTDLPDSTAESLPPAAKQSGRSVSMVEMREVVFGYEPQRPVLNRLSLQLEKGQVAGLVGPSGGGTSSVLKLLLGFYPLQQGEILLQGRPAGSMPLAELRAQIGYVPQEAHLFHGTIADNIRFGRSGATDEEVRSAAEAAFAHGFISGLPEGYETMVGERGSRLSGGQRQRIAIARALLRNAPILLLDEATSALDTESEHEVQQALQVLMKDRTTLIVAHRLSTVERADVIYVLEEGAVREQGSHLELLAKDGLYARLYEQQLLRKEEQVSA